MDSPLPLQCIVQGLLTVSGAQAVKPLTPTFAGRGVSDVVRVAGTNPTIAYVLTLDEGLPGNAGEVVPEGGAYPAALVPGAGSGASSLTNVPTPDIRCAFAIRGSSTNAVIGGTSIASIAVSYITPGPDGGFTQVQLIFQDTTGTAVDPTDAVAAGIEILIQKAQGQVDE
jgi:hypothetical protein